MAYRYEDDTAFMLNTSYSPTTPTYPYGCSAEGQRRTSTAGEQALDSLPPPRRQTSPSVSHKPSRTTYKEVSARTGLHWEDGPDRYALSADPPRDGVIARSRRDSYDDDILLEATMHHHAHPAILTGRTPSGVIIATGPGYGITSRDANWGVSLSQSLPSNLALQYPSRGSTPIAKPKSGDTTTERDDAQATAKANDTKPNQEQEDYNDDYVFSRSAPSELSDRDFEHNVADSDAESVPSPHPEREPSSFWGFGRLSLGS